MRVHNQPPLEELEEELEQLLEIQEQVVKVTIHQ
jgi:hypothetical protein